MTQPNILLILTDQVRFDCLGCAGHAVVQTPALDRLAGEGVRFRFAHTATVACGPARASLFTGLYPDHHGRHSNSMTLDPPGQPVLPEHLTAAGYDTALVGKLDLLPFERLWDDTTVLFTADHGDYAGQFGALYKGLPYEGSTHIPMIARCPAGLSGQALEQHVSNIDLFATCLDAAGVSAPSRCESRSLLPLLSAGLVPWDNRSLFKAGEQSFLVRDGWKLMRSGSAGKAVYELYDLRQSPLEAANRFWDAALGTKVAAMRAELDPWHAGQQRDRRCGSCVRRPGDRG